MIFKNVIPNDLCIFLTQYLLRISEESNKFNILVKDDQVPNATSISHSIIFDTLNERIWPFLEYVLKEELIPTYSYSRLYTNGDILHDHLDRPACEVSLTLQLGRSHHYSWPIFVDNKRYDLSEGDAILYYGCEQRHYRNECEGPEGYYSGQVFLHYVRAKGPYKEWAGDKRWDINNLPFKKYRSLLMETK